MNDIFKVINEADSILIGAGAGLSYAAGIEYTGTKFKAEFKPFIDKYGFTDLYTSSFYNFDSKEEYWAYWSKHINFANTGREGTETYKNIFQAIKNKNYFIITTNVDDQFYKTGFDKDKIFRVQGSYRLIQCSKACHNKLYDDKEIVNKMLKNIDKDLKIPSELIPICPVCGESIEPNLRKDTFFVQDDLWYEQEKAYSEFLENSKEEKLLLLEFGVGFNTPGIIRFPFEQKVSQNLNWKLIRFNKDCRSLIPLGDKLIEVTEDINEIFKK